MSPDFGKTESKENNAAEEANLISKELYLKEKENISFVFTGSLQSSIMSGANLVAPIVSLNGENPVPSVNNEEMPCVVEDSSVKGDEVNSTPIVSEESNLLADKMKELSDSELLKLITVPENWSSSFQLGKAKHQQEKNINLLKRRKQSFVDEWDACVHRIQVIEEDLRKVNGEMKDKSEMMSRHRTGLRGRNEARVDESIRRLNTQLQRNSYTLREEKKILDEIESLQRSKKCLKLFHASKTECENLRLRSAKLREDRGRLHRQSNDIENKIRRIVQHKEDIEKGIQLLTQRQEAALLAEKEFDAAQIELRLRSKKSRPGCVAINLSYCVPSALSCSPCLRSQVLSPVSASFRPNRVNLPTRNVCVKGNVTLTPAHKCTTLLQYLTDLLPQDSDTEFPRNNPPAFKESEQSPENVDVEGGAAVNRMNSCKAETCGAPPKRRSSKRQKKTRALAHPVDVIVQFTDLGISPPCSLEAVTSVISAIKDKQSELLSEHEVYCAIPELQIKDERQVECFRNNSSVSFPFSESYTEPKSERKLVVDLSASASSFWPVVNEVNSSDSPMSMSECVSTTTTGQVSCTRPNSLNDSLPTCQFNCEESQADVLLSPWQRCSYSDVLKKSLPSPTSGIGADIQIITSKLLELSSEEMGGSLTKSADLSPPNEPQFRKEDGKDDEDDSESLIVTVPHSEKDEESGSSSPLNVKLDLVSTSLQGNVPYSCPVSFNRLLSDEGVCSE